ncbi:MAG: sulfite exporter TauE/SafE family protein [Cyclobacteriaceae bacterium]|nr:sulfite exporter TauE/SafE family protein [Cyclobacteriaceae bacterium]
MEISPIYDQLFGALDIPWNHWGLALFGAFLLGLTKAGINGIAVMSVTLMVLAFGGRASTGILLPMLIVGDIMAVWYYHRHTQWKHLYKLMPWMVVGILVGVFTGKDLPEDLFRIGMGAIIIISLGIMIWWEKKDSKEVPDKWWFAGITGLLAGFTTMVGNLAGAFSNLYFLAMRLPKQHFIGTGAWLFLIINVFKVPFHVFVWETISWETFAINLRLIPGIVAGFVLGVALVKKIREKKYRQLIILLTGVGALLIFIL